MENAYVRNAEIHTDKEVAFRERKRWGFLGLPFTFTVYKVSEDLLTVDKGFFTVDENDCYLYKVQDAKLSRTLMERMFGTGTITCYTGDVTDRKIVLKHIKHSKEVKNYILEYSEKARLKRRTVNAQNIGAEIDHSAMDDTIDDLDGYLDN